MNYPCPTDIIVPDKRFQRLSFDDFYGGDPIICQDWSRAYGDDLNYEEKRELDEFMNEIGEFIKVKDVIEKKKKDWGVFCEKWTIIISGMGIVAAFIFSVLSLMYIIIFN